MSATQFEEIAREAAEKARRAKEEREEHARANGHAGAEPPPLTPAAWAARDIEPPDCLLGELLSTTNRSLFAADTGLGKTMLSMPMSLGMSQDKGFLHWSAVRPARVLYLDGEMPAELFKERIVEECRRLGVDPAAIADGMFFMNREFHPDMPPLDTEDGAKWLMSTLDTLAEGPEAPVDVVMFDNLMSLTQGDLREETTWAALKGLVLDLSKRHVGQWWIHHMGHDKTRPYGSKTFQWHMDNVIVGEAIAAEEREEDADVAIKLSFTKARRRKPTNRTDFEPVTVALRDGLWSSSAASAGTGGAKKLTARGQLCLDALQRAVAQAGEKPPHHPATRHAQSAVKVTLWRTYFEQITAYDKGSSTLRQAWAVGTQELLRPGGHAVKWGDWAWLR